MVLNTGQESQIKKQNQYSQGSMQHKLSGESKETRQSTQHGYWDDKLDSLLEKQKDQSIDALRIPLYQPKGKNTHIRVEQSTNDVQTGILTKKKLRSKEFHSANTSPILSRCF